jgi:hypothetical protein
MSDEKGKKEVAVPEKASGNRESSSLAFALVVIMLAFLFILILVLLFLPSSEDNLEYHKWALTTLIGTFGAWIGAGAAYFFGKENLKESSASTEAALKIQQESFRRPSGIERIKDMILTAMNSNFMFNLGDDKNKVKAMLDKDEYRGYWFVPIVDEKTGNLQDIIHAQVFWDTGFMKDKDNPVIKDIISKMDKSSLKNLHGDLFYATVSPDDKINDVYKRLSQKGAQVAIVVDERGKASHCMTQTELRTFLTIADNT